MGDMDGSNQDANHVTIKVLADQVALLSSQMFVELGKASLKQDAMMRDMGDLKTGLAVIDERTKGETRSSSNMSDTAWKMATILVSIIALAVAAFAVIMHK